MSALAATCDSLNGAVNGGALRTFWRTRSLASGRFAHIDAMRAFAVLLVVVAHAGLGHIVPGGAGVTIFFAISGFIITSLVLKESQRTGRFEIGGFYVRRAVKLIPPLVMVLLIPTIIYDLVGESIDWGAVTAQMFFYYNWLKLDHLDVFPGSAVVWSLSIEEQFYIAFAILWLVVVRTSKAIPWLTAVAVLTICASTTLRFLFAQAGSVTVADRIYYGSDTRADSIAWGILAAVALHKWQRDTQGKKVFQRLVGAHWTLIIAVGLFLTSLIIRDDWYRQTIRYSLQSVTTCMVVLYGFVSADTLLFRAFSAACRIHVIQVIGLASYSIYLVHFSIAQYVLPKMDWLPRPALVVVATTLALVAGIALYHLVEIPSRAVYDRFRRRQEHENTEKAAAGLGSGSTTSANV
ncbi:acyltransferase family protein [Mycolicibacterium baixiangningiae]|uniref:acyltransferase family protein n=1 Tax=Mycolicibacterium baixiangningiae TaxID=2761578 RepID=UPI0018D1655C|nr:acyltransferase [Mycolicibacterium baixiangningiae]